MSTKRILAISVIGILLIAAVITVLLLTSFREQEAEAVRLPGTISPVDRPADPVADTLDRVEVNRETIRAVVYELARPEVYSREITVENHWSYGSAEYKINISVDGDISAIRSTPSAGPGKRIIITRDNIYIWYEFEREYFTGSAGSSGDGYRTADEWQMIVSYEDILALDDADIIDAGYVIYDDRECVYAVYRSPLLGYTRTCYISLELGLVIAAEEHDTNGLLVYSMYAGECIVDEVVLSYFILPNGRNLRVSA